MYKFFSLKNDKNKNHFIKKAMYKQKNHFFQFIDEGHEDAEGNKFQMLIAVGNNSLLVWHIL